MFIKLASVTPLTLPEFNANIVVGVTKSSALPIYRLFEALMFPITSNLNAALGLVVPIPTFPELSILIFTSVPAPPLTISNP